MKDDLQALLHSWNPTLPDAAELRRQVWNRLDTEAQPSVWLWSFRPLRWALALLLIGLGLTVSIILGVTASDAALTRAYLSSVNPYSHFQ
jgi:hypothetical protein